MWLQNQNPFSSSFPWQELPSISLPADYSGNSCRAFPCFFFFFLACILWREVTATSSTRTLSPCFRCLAWTQKQWKNCHERLPHEIAGAFCCELGGTIIMGTFLATLPGPGETLILHTTTYFNFIHYPVVNGI